MSEPRTASGRALLDELLSDGYNAELTLPLFLAIEAEARAAALDEAWAAVDVWRVSALGSYADIHNDAIGNALAAIDALREVKP